MSNQTILYFMAGTVALFLIVVIAYVILRKKMGKSEMRKMKELQEGTKEKKFSSDVTYQKLYLIYNKIPLLKRYVKKLRRKIEIISIEDEYITRRQTAKHSPSDHEQASPPRPKASRPCQPTIRTPQSK